MQANEVVKILTGIGEVLSGQLLIFNMLDMQSYTINIERNPSITDLMPKDKIKFETFDYGLFCNVISKGTNNEIQADTLDTLLKNNRDSIQLLDVREHNEMPKLTMLKELNIPLAEIIENVNQIDHNKKVVVMCNTGVRSNIAIQLLKNKFGKINLVNLKGGISEWIKKYKT